jgi:hypothetical protein
MCAVLRMEAFGWAPDEAFDGFNKIWENLETFVKGYKPTGALRAPDRAH